MYIMSGHDGSSQRRRELTLIIVRMTLTVPKTALAGVMLERFSAKFRPSMTIFNEKRTLSRRFDCLAFGSMGSKSVWERKDVVMGRLRGRPWTLIDMSGNRWCGTAHDTEPFKDETVAWDGAVRRIRVL
jgi:hypothetical protein